MPLLVQKYGGTCMATVERIRAVARRVIKARKEGYQVVAVVSAMGDTTDNLVELISRPRGSCLFTKIIEDK